MVTRSHNLSLGGPLVVLEFCDTGSVVALVVRFRCFINPLMRVNWERLNALTLDITEVNDYKICNTSRDLSSSNTTA